MSTVDAATQILEKANQLRKKKIEKKNVGDKYPLSTKLFFAVDDKKLKNDIKRKGPPHPYYNLTYRDAVIDTPHELKICNNNRNGGNLFDYKGNPFWHPKFDPKLRVKASLDGLNAEKKQQEIDMSDSSTTDQNLVIKPEDALEYFNGRLQFFEMPPHESLILHPWGPLSAMEAKTQFFTADVIKSNTIKATVDIKKDPETTNKKKNSKESANATSTPIKWGPIPTSITIYNRTKPKEQLNVKFNPKDFHLNKKHNKHSSNTSQDEDTEGD
uniref:Protein TSSC4 n=1 Tax=Strongyloides papillosus TaxID=174720 RepID=A0A0N5C318_STREA